MGLLVDVKNAIKKIDLKINRRNLMKILIACEESQRVCEAFRNRGHEAYSCDIIDCSGDIPNGISNKIVFLF